MKDFIKRLELIVDSLDFAVEYNAALLTAPKKYEMANKISSNLKKCIKEFKKDCKNEMLLP